SQRYKQLIVNCATGIFLNFWILIRFPNGERREQSFLRTDKIQSIYRYIDSLGLPGVGNYKLISSFPRRVFGVDQMGITLEDAGLHPRASLFLEPSE
ncbi:hypothetical protein CISIN_1g0452961mg, partial [Citrus sinensis]